MTFAGLTSSIESINYTTDTTYEISDQCTAMPLLGSIDLKMTQIQSSTYMFGLQWDWAQRRAYFGYQELNAKPILK